MWWEGALEAREPALLDTHRAGNEGPPGWQATSFPQAGSPGGIVSLGAAFPKLQTFRV